jgi:hypothetical protein
LQFGNNDEKAADYFLDFDFINSENSGRKDIIIIAMIIGRIYLSAPGIIRPKKYPEKIRSKDQTRPPAILYNMKFLYFICPTPATIGAKVLTTGTNLAKKIVLLPYLS